MTGSGHLGEALTAALAIAALSICAAACGEGGNAASSRASTSVSVSARSPQSGATAGTGTSAGAPSSEYAGDGEGEIEEGIRSVGYHDADDVRITGIGHAAGRAYTRAVASIVYGYQAATAAGDARRACALVTKPVFRAVGPDYDQTPSHRTRRSKTCVGGMAFLFKVYHAKMTARSTVTSVRIKGKEAYALVGSPTARAGYFMLEREHGRWRISVLLTLGLS